MVLNAIIEDLETANSVSSEASLRSIPDLKARKRELEESHNSSISSFYVDDVNSHHTEENDKQVRQIGEAILLYNYAEKAALKIQRVFRENKERGFEKGLGIDSTTADEDSDSNQKDIDLSSDPIEEEDEDRSHLYTLIFVGLFTAVMILPKMVMGCVRVFASCVGDDSGADAAVNATVPQGGGGGGGPSGGEGAQGAMAAQAAGAAAGGAASGVAAGAAAGAAAASAAAAATAGATAAAAGAAQVATVVAVSTAAVAATVAGVSVAVSVAPVPILSTCGIVNPDVRSGRFTMFFEGIPRPFDARESLLVQNLIMESYNEITIGPNNECFDPLSREMQNLTMVNQTFTPIGEGVDQPVLEIVVDATLSCDRCSTSSPLFSRDQLLSVANETQDPTTIAPEEATRHRLLQSFDFESQEFFQKLIQLIMFDTEALTEMGELPSGFQKISKAFVISNEEEVLLETDVKYEKTEERTIIEFIYVDDETGEDTKETFEVTSRGEGVPTTSLPTAQPSSIPTGIPSILPTSSPTQTASQVPTGIPSVQPTNIASESPSAPPTMFPSESPSSMPSIEGSLAPSASPSEAPSFSPSESPSAVPSVSPSESPSAAPSTSPSASPSSTPSASPSSTPSSSPSESPSLAPSAVPSTVPSFVPSTTPSMVPSVSPSESPSFVPSAVPSTVPSFVPSTAPSMVPSVSPSESPSFVPSAVPSTVPSFVPSTAPSMVPSVAPSEMPSFVPSVAPSMVPSVSPSESPSTVPSTRPSQIPSLFPSELPSNVPSTSPSGVPSFVPSFAPSQVPSTEPSQLPSVVPSESPSMVPSVTPSMIPSRVPSASPSMIPSVAPSMRPSRFPSQSPSAVPSTVPSYSPTNLASAQPTGIEPLIKPLFPAFQSSDFSSFATAEKVIDGNTNGSYNGQSLAHTAGGECVPWWYVDLNASGGDEFGWGAPVTVKTVKIWNRTGCCWTRLNGAIVKLLSASEVELSRATLSVADNAPKIVDFGTVLGVARIEISLPDCSNLALQLAEVQAWGIPPP